MYLTDSMKKLFAIIFIFAMLFSACAPKEIPSESAATHEPQATAPAATKDIVVLSYPSADLSKLNRVTFELPVLGNSLAHSAASSLLFGMGAQDYFVPFGGKAAVLSSEVSRNLVKLNIGVDLSSLTDRELFCSIISLTNTLTELDGIDYVKLKINGDDFKPTGIFSNPLIHQSENLYLLYLKNIDYLKNGTPDVLESSSKSLLYFTDLSGKFLIAEVRSGYRSGENFAVDLINQLKSGPAASDEMKGTIPKNVVMQNEPSVYEDAQYGTVLSISFEAPKHEAIDNDARYMMAASIVTTIQSNIPGIDAVRVFINSQPAISTSMMHEKDFDGLLGNIVTLYFPNAEMTYLIPVSRAMSQEQYMLPRNRIHELMLGLLPNETDSAVNIFPSSITDDDVLSVTVSGDVAYVDFTLDLMLYCDYSSEKESMFVYSIVNTLCEYKNIKRVQILIEGNTEDTLCGNISIEEPLLPNPGIIQR